MDCTRREVLGKLAVGFLGISAMTAGLPVNEAEAEVVEKIVVKEKLIKPKTRKAKVTEKVEIIDASGASNLTASYYTEHEVEIIDTTMEKFAQSWDVTYKYE